MNTLAIRILPHLDEFTVYVYGVSFAFLLVLSSDFRHFFFGTGNGSHFFLAIMYLIFGILLLAIQVIGGFSKSPIEKKLLLFYTITSCIMVGMFVLFNEPNLFPA